MSAHTLLTGIAKAVVADMASSGVSLETQCKIRLLHETPEVAFDLVHLMTKEGAKKRPKINLIQGYAFLLGQALEQLRYAVEQGEASAAHLVARLRDDLLGRGESGQITAPMLQLILSQFAAAKLEMGDALRELMQRLAEVEAEETLAAEPHGKGDELAEVARQLDGDPFAIHDLLDGSAETTPEELRAKVVMAMFGQGEPAIREAASGFLLNGSGLVRSKLAEVIELAAPHGLVSPTMLRRMIAMRNWLPAPDRPALDKAIKACRTKGIDCAPWPQPKGLQILASGIDGSGAHTILVITKAAGKHVLAAVLMKHDAGVREAWVRRGVTKAETRDLATQIAGEIGLAPSTMDYVALATRHFLAINGRSGVMPPFGLLDFAETVGLSDLHPAPQPTERLVATLCDAIDPARLTEVAVAGTMLRSADWADEHPIVASWFEANVATSLGRKPGARSRQVATLLAGALQSRRERWADIAAWTALGLKHRPGNTDWEGFAILARELLGQRPLDEIGIMRRIAETSLNVIEMERLLGALNAA